MNDEDFIAKMETLHHRFWLQSDAERLLALANALEAKCAALEADAARKVSGGPNVNWLMKPSLDWLENAEHGENQARCRMIAGMLRDLWRGNDTLGAMPVAIGGEKK